MLLTMRLFSKSEMVRWYFTCDSVAQWIKWECETFCSVFKWNPDAWKLRVKVSKEDKKRRFTVKHRGRAAAAVPQALSAFSAPIYCTLKEFLSPFFKRTLSGWIFQIFSLFLAQSQRYFMHRITKITVMKMTAKFMNNIKPKLSIRKWVSLLLHEVRISRTIPESIIFIFFPFYLHIFIVKLSDYYEYLTYTFRSFSYISKLL